jgi:queuine tRNA-ribosyltransferase subunit QTRTD1
MPDDFLLVLGPRRVPSIVSPTPNTPASVSILTSTGFRQLRADEYAEAARKLQPDVVVGMADLVMGREAGRKRRGKMVDRTHAHTMHAAEKLYGGSSPDAGQQQQRAKSAFFAPVLPLENTQQSLYLEELEDELRPYVSGLALYEPASLSVIPDSLGSLPRLLFSEPPTPHDALKEVSLGADLLTLPFLVASSDAGMALDFVFPPAPSGSDASRRPLAFNLWSSEYAADLSPLSDNCSCYTCQNHHRAYLNHLLIAKEMLAWTLLQIHNHHVVDNFFSGIRVSIEKGSFDEDAQAFHRIYTASMPERTGEGPRYVYHLFIFYNYPQRAWYLGKRALQC